jgi:hypothetical protein
MTTGGNDVTASDVSAQGRNTAVRLCFSARAAELFHAGRAPRGNLALFLHNELFGDAVRYLADLLPPRAAVWWASQCVWDAVRPHADEEARNALAAVLRWVVDPTDAHREAARPAERDNPLDTPWGCLKMAVVWTGGSLSDPGLPVVPPADYATPRALAGAIMLAAVHADPLPYLDRYRRFLDLGLHIAQGRNLWWQSSASNVPVTSVGETPQVEGILS